MDLFLKILIAVTAGGALVVAVVLGERALGRLHDPRWRALARASLFAFALTPTAYHHAPNTIVAPLHLSTICGHLFYGYTYTVTMFVQGVLMPIVCAWVLLSIVFLFRLKAPALPCPR